MDFSKDYSFFEKCHLGLLSADFAIILSLLQVQQLDSNLQVCLLSFAFNLPINAYFGFAQQLYARTFFKKYSERTHLLMLPMAYSTIFSLLLATNGVGFLLEHFSPIAPFILCAGMVAVIICLIDFSKKNGKLDEMKKKEIEKEKLSSPNDVIDIHQPKDSKNK